jgi:hypothetical protein
LCFNNPFVVHKTLCGSKTFFIKTKKKRIFAH